MEKNNLNISSNGKIAASFAPFVKKQRRISGFDFLSHDFVPMAKAKPIFDFAAFRDKPVSKGFDVLLDSFRSENTVVNVATGISHIIADRKFIQEPGFDGIAAIKGTIYEQNALDFATAKNPAHVRAIKDRIDAENLVRQRNYNTHGFTSGLATFLAVATSPENYIPYFNTLKAAKIGSRLASGAIKGAGTNLLGEAILHGTQYNRTLEQSTFNVVGGAVGGSFFFGVLGKRTSSEIGDSVARAKQGIDDALGVSEKGTSNASPKNSDIIATEDGRVINPDTKIVPKDLSASSSTDVAQPSYRESLFDNSPVSALGLEKIPANPVARLFQSAELRAKEITQELVDIPFYLYKNLRGVATPTSVRGAIDTSYTWKTVEALRNIDNEYLAYRNIIAKDSALARSAQIGFNEIKGRITKSDTLTPSQFRKEVGIAMNNGDVHAIPEVVKAAGHARKILNKLKEDAIAVDAFPRAQELLKSIENVKKRIANGRGNTESLGNELKFLEGELKDARVRGPAVIGAKSYFPRIWRTDKILNDLPRFKQIIKNHLIQTGVRNSKGKTVDELTNDIAESVIQDRGFVPIGQEFVARAAGLRERVFDIPHEAVQDFLEHDVEAVLRHHVRQIGADIKLTERFDTVDMRSHIDEVKANWKARINATTDPEKAKQFREQAKADVRDIEALRDRIRGTYGLPINPHSTASKTAHMFKQYNSLLYLGGGVVSALVDLARPLMVEGIKRTVHDTFSIFSSNSEKMLFKMAKREVQMSGTALDIVLGSRALALADIGNVYGRSGGFEGALGIANNAMFMVNLMNPWTETMKSWSGLITMNRILQATGKMGEADIKKLAASGIDNRVAKDIAEQFKAHGETIDGVRIANTEQWTNPLAVDAFRNATRREVDISIVTPGEGDRPLWMSGELGSVIGQFKSFALATVNRVLIPGLQEKDAKFANGVLLTMGLGMLADSIKRAQWQSKKDRSFDQRLIDGFDRSGLGGYFIDINNAIENLSDNKLGLSPMFGDKQGFTSFGRKIGVFGPTASTAANLGRIMRGAGTLQFDRGEAIAIRKAIPFQNHIALTAVFDKFEKGLEDAFAN